MWPGRGRRSRCAGGYRRGHRARGGALRLDRDRRLQHGRPAHHGGRRGVPRRAAERERHRRDLGHGRRLRALLRRRDRYLERLAPDRRRGRGAPLRRCRRRVHGVPGRRGRPHRGRQPGERLGNVPDRRPAQHHVGAEGGRQSQELEPDRPELPGPGARPCRSRDGLRDVRLLHGRDQRRGGREPVGLHRQRGRQRHRAGGRRRPGRPRIPGLHVLRGEHGLAQGRRGRRRRRLRRSERRGGPGRHLRAALAPALHLREERVARPARGLRLRGVLLDELDPDCRGLPLHPGARRAGDHEPVDPRVGSREVRRVWQRKTPP